MTAFATELSLPLLLADAGTQLAARAQASVVQVLGQRRGGGSGVVWGDGRTILTNHHVVAGVGERPSILAPDGQRYQARFLAGDERLDLALLSLETGTLRPAILGDSRPLRVGELVFAIGSPWGQRSVVTVGIISAVGTIPSSRRDELPARYIRSDVRLAPGNSGGPLLNARGAVIGINAMIFGGDLSVAIPTHVALEWIGAHAPVI